MMSRVLSGSALALIAPGLAQAAPVSSTKVSSTAPGVLAQPSLAAHRAYVKQLEAQGQLDAAARELALAVRQNPKSVDAAREQARFASRHQRFEDASQAWRQVLFLRGGDTEAKAELTRVLAHLQSKPENYEGLPVSPASVMPLRATTRALASESPRAASSTNASRVAQAPAEDATDADAFFDGNVSSTAPVTAPLPAPPQFEAPSVQAPTLRSSARGTATPVLAPLAASAPVRAVQFVPPSPRRAVAVSRQRRAAAFPLVNRAARELKAGRTQSALDLYRRAQSVDPNNEYAAPNVATSLYILKRYDEAATTLLNFLALKPNNSEALRRLADVYTYGKKYRQALGVNNYILNRKPNDFAALYQNAQLATYLGDYAQSNSFFTRASRQQPRNPEVLAAWGESLSYRRDSRAPATFRRALDLRPNYGRAIVGLGNAYTYTGQFDLAIPQYRAALRLPGQSQNATTLLALGNAQLYAGRYQDALPQFRTVLRTQPNNQTARLGLGRALVFSGQAAAGARELNSVLSADPNNLAALETLALAQATTDPARAISTYNKLLARQTDPLTRARTLATIGDLRAANNDFNGASASYRQALALAPRDLGLGLSYAQLLFYQGQNARDLANAASTRSNSATEQGQAEQAESQGTIAQQQSELARERFTAARPYVQNVLASQPSNPRARALQLQIELGLGNTARAQELATQLDNVYPNDPNEALALAYALKDAGNNEQALRVIDRASARVSDPATALKLAQSARDSEDYESAIRIYNRVLSSNSNNATARLELARTFIYRVFTNRNLDNSERGRGVATDPARTASYSRDLESARAQIDAAAQIEPNNPLASTVSVELLEATATPNALDEAFRVATAIVTREPNNVPARLTLGRLNTQRAENAAALGQYREVLALEPNNTEARLGLARNLNYTRDSEGAITAYRELIRLAPADVLPRLELAQILVDRNRLSEAETLYNEVLAIRRGATALGSVREAIETRSLARLSPGAKMNSPLRVQYASRRVVLNASAVRKGRRVVVDAPRAVSPLRLTQAASPTVGAGSASGTTSAAPPAASGAGTAPAPAAPLGSPDDELPSIETAPGVGDPAPVPVPPEPVFPQPNAPVDVTPAPLPNPQLPTTPVEPVGPTIPAPVIAPPVATTDPVLADQGTALRGLAEVRLRQNRATEAAELFNQALALVPGDVLARVGLARALRDSDNFTQALAETDRALTLVPGFLPARVLRAQLLSDTGQSAAASEEFNAILASIPENASLETFLTLSQALNTQRNYERSLALLDVAASQYPTEPTVPRLRAETLTFARRFDEAIGIYDTLLATNPNDADAILGKARVYNYSDRLPQSEQFYRQLLQVQPSNPQATTELADVLGRRSNFAESIQLYRIALESNPNDLATQVELARVQRLAGQPAEAEATLASVLQSDPRFVAALVERGVLRGTLGSYESSIADLQAALAIAPADLNAQIGLAQVQGYAGQYEQSIAGYREVLKSSPDNLAARIQLGSVLSYAGRTDEALKEIDAALVQNPTDITARLARADVLGRGTRTNEAVQAYNAILAEDPNNVRARTGLADTYLYGRRYADAIRVYDALIVTDPTNVAFRVQRARALGYNRQPALALAALRPLVAANPNNLSARLALAEAGANSGNPTFQREGIVQYRSILASDPSNVSARVGLGRALSYAGNYSESTTVLNGVLTTNPNNAEARYALAEVQRFQGRNFDARDNYKQVLTLQPNNSQAQANLGDVSRLTSSTAGISFSRYSDSNGVRLKSFNFGPTLRTRGGTIGIIAERGTFEQNGVERDRRNTGILLGRQFGPVQASLALSRLKYEGARSRTLFDLFLQTTPGPRRRLFAGVGRRDIYESDTAVTNSVVATIYRAGFTQPLGQRFDLEGQAIYYDYSDDNSRITLLPSLFYRFRPTNPTLRIGIGGAYDNSDEQRNEPVFVYYAPQDFKAASLLADYVVDQGRTRYGISAAKALTGRTGDNNANRPADTLFGFVEQDFGAFTVFANGGVVRTPDFDSNQFTVGGNFRF